MSQPGPILAIEAGGTKTEAARFGSDGTVLARTLAGPGNYQRLGPEGLKDLVIQLLSILNDEAALGEIECAALAMAGLAGDRDTAVARSILSKLLPGIPVVATSDARAALTGACGESGILIIAGTGSIVVGRNGSGRELRCGGWGSVLGDEGSAYDLGKRALIRACRVLDGRDEPTRFTHRVLDTFAPEDRGPARDSILDRVTSVDQTAALAPMICQAALEDDADAREIINTGAAALTQMTVAVARGLDLDQGSAELALFGGLLGRPGPYSDEVQRQLRTALPDCRPSLAPADAALKGVAGMASARLQEVPHAHQA